MKPITRMAALSAMALAFVASTLVPSAAADQVTLRLNWLLSGLHAPFYLGLERGYYSEAGIDLAINEGKGSGATLQGVAAKGDTFGLSDAGTLMLGASKGQNVKAVMSLVNTSSFGIIALADANIRTPQDLQGKSIAVSPGDAMTLLFPAVTAANNLDADGISLVFMDPGAKPVAVMQGKADALLGGLDDQVFLIEAQGYETSTIRFADVGANTVGITVHAHEDTIRDNPDMVRRFVEASRRSWQAAIDDPRAAVDAALKVKPDLSADTLLQQFEVAAGLLQSANTAGKPIGYGAEADWELTKELLVKYRELVTDRAASTFYTNEFGQ